MSDRDPHSSEQPPLPREAVEQVMREQREAFRKRLQRLNNLVQQEVERLDPVLKWLVALADRAPNFVQWNQSATRLDVTANSLLELASRLFAASTIQAGGTHDELTGLSVEDLERLNRHQLERMGDSAVRSWLDRSASVEESTLPNLAGGLSAAVQMYAVAVQLQQLAQVLSDTRKGLEEAASPLHWLQADTLGWVDNLQNVIYDLRETVPTLAGFPRSATKQLKPAPPRLLRPQSSAAISSLVAQAKYLTPATAKQLREIACWSVRSPQQVMFSSGGQFLAVRPFQGLFLLSTSQWETMRDIADGANASDLAFMPDDKRLCWSSLLSNNLINIVDLSSNAILETFTLDEILPVADKVAVSAFGRLLAMISSSGMLHVWRLDNRSLVIQEPASRGYKSTLAFSPDGFLVAYGSVNGQVHVRSVEDDWKVDLRSEQAQEGYENAVQSLAFSPDGTLIAAGLEEQSAHVWRVEDGSHVHTLRHYGPVTAVRFSPDGELLASGDFSVRLWNAKTGACVCELDDYNKDVVQSIDFSPDGRLLCAGGDDHTVQIWAVPG